MRTLILSPDTIFAEALSMCLTADDGIEVVGLALDARAAEDAIGALAPAVVVCDQRSVGPEPWSQPPPAAPADREPLRAVLIATMTEPTRPQADQFDAVVPPRSSLDRVVAAIREVAWHRSPSTPQRVAVAVPELSRREHEVLELLSLGVGTGGIAAQLHLSQHTVRNHVRRLTAKLGVRSRLEAVTEGRRLGLLS